MLEIKLLRHQYDFVEDTTTKILGLIGGYGSGKTFAAANKVLYLAHLNAGYIGLITEPNYPMLRDIFIPTLKEVLEIWKTPYKFNAADSIFFLQIEGKETKIICKSLENTDRLVGINAAWIVADEFDTTKQDIAYKAYLKLLGRLRAGNVRQFCITTTPEGFKAAYKIFVEEEDAAKRIISASSLDNKYLPLDFIETLKKQYPAHLLEAYLYGKFVNLQTGTIFYNFNRKTHSSLEEYNNGQEIIIGQDFNIGGCVSIVFIKKNDTLIAVDELESYDTSKIILNIKSKYPNTIINIYPDVSGNQNKTSAPQSDINMLRNAGFKVFVNSINPNVVDRYTISNKRLEDLKILVNIGKCPKLTKALEQHAYGENGSPTKINGAATIDDYTDAFSYPIAFLYPIVVKKPYVKIEVIPTVTHMSNLL